MGNQWLRKAPQILVLMVFVFVPMTIGNPLDGRTVSCGPVENMKVTEKPDEFQVTWDPPIDDPENRICGTLYRIFVERNSLAHHSGSTNQLEYSISKDDSCGHYIFMVMSSNIMELPAASRIKIHSSGLKGPGKVENLEIEDNMISWDRPSYSDDCDLRYDVYITTEGLEPIHDDNVQDTFFEWFLIPCSVNNIHVTAIVKITEEREWRGEPTIIERYGLITMLAPIHIRTVPDETGAWVKWIPAEEKENLCDILLIQFSFLETDLEDINLSKEEEGKYRLDTSTADSAYRYEARWLLREGFGVSSETISFRTAPLTPPTHISTRWIDHELRIEWEQDYDRDFITRQEVTVKSLGVQHFVPDCPPAEDGAFDNIAPGTNYWHFDDAKSNVKYHVTVTTHFETLGISQQTSVELISPMKAPGDLEEIITWHDYEVSVPYQITSYFKWKIPCDINGPVKHFEVTISGTPQIVGVTETNCDIIFLSVDIPGAEEETYEYYATNLVPFFAYTLHITTVLDTPSEAAKLWNDDESDFSPLPTAYTPSYSPQDPPAYVLL